MVDALFDGAEAFASMCERAERLSRGSNCLIWRELTASADGCRERSTSDATNMGHSSHASAGSYSHGRTLVELPESQLADVAGAAPSS